MTVAVAVPAALASAGLFATASALQHTSAHQVPTVGRLSVSELTTFTRYKALREYAYLVDDNRSLNSVVIEALTAYLTDEGQVAQLASAKAEAAERSRWWWSRQ